MRDLNMPSLVRGQRPGYFLADGLYKSDTQKGQTLKLSVLQNSNSTGLNFVHQVYVLANFAADVNKSKTKATAPIERKSACNRHLLAKGGHAMQEGI
jgi:hypothetical protein